LRKNVEMIILEKLESVYKNITPRIKTFSQKTGLRKMIVLENNKLAKGGGK
jgi:hypothetical protein